MLPAYQNPWLPLSLLVLSAAQATSWSARAGPASKRRWDSTRNARQVGIFLFAIAVQGGGCGHGRGSRLAVLSFGMGRLAEVKATLARYAPGAGGLSGRTRPVAPNSPAGGSSRIRRGIANDLPCCPQVGRFSPAAGIGGEEDSPQWWSSGR